MHSQLVTDIILFLREIGLTMIARPVAGTTVLPGIGVDHGALVVDRTTLKYPGDLLHEAGHFAVVPPHEREQFHDNVGDDGGMEMGAIAWSYAAAMHLGIAPSVLFHDASYRRGADSLLQNFVAGYFAGVPILTWRGLADAPAGSGSDAAGYPQMKRWLTA
jgi:hypothetical protein